MRSLSAEELRNVCGDEYQPTVDGTFLPDFPENLFKLDYLHKTIDVIYGFNSDEGAMFIYGLNGFQLIRNRQEAERILDQLVDKMFFRGSAKCEQIKHVLRREYLSDGDTAERLTHGLIQLHGDLLFVAPTFQCAALSSQQGNRCISADGSRRYHRSVFSIMCSA